MRFGLIFDVHASDKTPSTRKDDYKAAVLKKLEFVIEESNKRHYDAILMLGDLFHKKIPSHNSHSLISALISIFQKSKAPIYIIAGNHDISGNITNLWQQPLYVLLKAGVLHILENAEPIIFTEGDLKVSINGVPFLAQRDSKESISLYNLKHADDAQARIGLFHQMILPDGMKFFSDYVNFSDLLGINSNIVIDGHYHVGFDPSVQMVGDHYFINGGALSRGSSEHFNLTKKPCYVELTITPQLDSFKLDWEDIVVPHEDASKIFDTVAIKRKKETQEMKNFIQNLSEFESESLTSQTPDGVIRILKTMGMKEELLPVADRYLTSAYERMNI